MLVRRLRKGPKFQGAIKPKLWWRYRDHIDVWTHGLDILLEFTEYINSEYSTVKFELVYSEGESNVLDLTLHMVDGFISTDVCAKPTVSHLYLPYSSSYLLYCKRAISYGVALRLKRNFSKNEYLKEKCKVYES